MNKKYIITFSVSVLVIFSISIILLMLLLPQQSNIVKGTIDSYKEVKKSEYTYESTKDISEEPLVRKYSITAEDIAKFKNKKQYKPGNADPFTPNTESNNSQGNGSNNTENPSKDANDKTTNSNGGTANPPATNK